MNKIIDYIKLIQVKYLKIRFTIWFLTYITYYNIQIGIVKYYTKEITVRL